MQRNSLVGVSIANRILERHDVEMSGGPHIERTGPNQVIFVQPTYDMRFIGRFCTIKGERSGGYVIKGALNERYDHESGFIKYVEKHLKPGWTNKHLQRACHRIFVELSELRTLQRHREQVKTLAEGIKNLDTEYIEKGVETMSLNKSHIEIEYAHELDDLCEDLMGQPLADCEDDQSGTNWDRDRWVSSEGIAQALIDAYERGLRRAGYKT
jgi:hypothetical protein